MVELVCADNLVALDELPDKSVDSVVSDPPYGISLMGKDWDHDVPKTELWQKVFRVMKPGAHLLTFGGARTYHRLVCRVEDAGFEIRTMIPWIHAQGFLKGLDVSKQFEKMNDPDHAKEWDGWNVVLSPCAEPICLARKPLEKGLTVTENVLKWGTGAINIKACMIGDHEVNINRLEGWSGFGQLKCPKYKTIKQKGLMPKNVLFDESAIDTLPERAQGYYFCSKATRDEKNAGLDDFPVKQKVFNGQSSQSSTEMKDVEKRFTTKPQANHHVSVKPVDLMAYLIKLVTRPNGVVLDPFMGSGTTGVAAAIYGYGFIGIEIDSEYFDIAEARIRHWSDNAIS